jgi:phosphatidylserine/phosphatidylglycerophosphate/cardiolipin synthase-like enzyme
VANEENMIVIESKKHGRRERKVYAGLTALGADRVLSRWMTSSAFEQRKGDHVVLALTPVGSFPLVATQSAIKFSDKT